MKNKLAKLENIRKAMQRIFLLGFGLLAIGAVVFTLMGNRITEVTAVIFAMAYFAIMLGGSLQLLLYSYIGFIKKDITVTAESAGFDMRYRGSSAKIWSIVGICIATIILLLSLTPIYFMTRANDVNSTSEQNFGQKQPY